MFYQILHSGKAPQKSSLLQVLKGDVPGHAFHGNQYSQGMAGDQPYNGKDGFTRSGGLNPTERRIESKFIGAIKSNEAGLISQYKTAYGNVVDPDKVKKLSPEFAANSDLAGAVHEPSSYLAKKIYSDMLRTQAARDTNSPVVFTAGGSGSGKSESQPLALAAAGIQTKPSTVYDSVLGNFSSAQKRIDEALNTVKGPVHLVYTNTPIEKAAAFNALRDRSVTASTLVGAHLGASNTIRQLATHYAGNPRVVVTVVNNSAGKGQATIGKVSDVPVYAKQDLTNRVAAVHDSLLRYEAINTAQYNHLNQKAH